MRAWFTLLTIGASLTLLMGGGCSVEHPADSLLIDEESMTSARRLLLSDEMASPSPSTTSSVLAINTSYSVADPDKLCEKCTGTRNICLNKGDPDPAKKRRCVECVEGDTKNCENKPHAPKCNLAPTTDGPNPSVDITSLPEYGFCHYPKSECEANNRSISYRVGNNVDYCALRCSQGKVDECRQGGLPCIKAAEEKCGAAGQCYDGDEHGSADCQDTKGMNIYCYRSGTTPLGQCKNCIAHKHCERFDSSTTAGALKYFCYPKENGCTQDCANSVQKKQSCEDSGGVCDSGLCKFPPKNPPPPTP